MHQNHPGDTKHDKGEGARDKTGPHCKKMVVERIIRTKARNVKKRRAAHAQHLIRCAMD